MTALLLDRPVATRRSCSDFIAEASEAAEDARLRAQVARLLAEQSAHHPADPATRLRNLRRLQREAITHERDALRHEEAVAAVRGLVTDLRVN